MSHRIALVGCGFLGGVFLEETIKRSKALDFPLSIHVIDCDEVAERNLSNQNFLAQDVGKNKAIVMDDRYSNCLWASVFGNDNPVEKVFVEPKVPIFDVIVCAVDNQEARDHVWYYAMQHDIPLLMLGLSQEGQGQVEWVHQATGVDCCLSPLQKATRGVINDVVVKLPPCELTRWRAAGWNTAMCGVRSLFIMFGFDPEEFAEQVTSLVNWRCTNDSSVITSSTPMEGAL